MKLVSSLTLIAVCCICGTGACGLEPVEVRPEGGAAAGGASAGGGEAGGAHDGGAAIGGTNGGGPATGGGDTGGRAGECGEPTADNLVVDGGFEDPSHWYPIGVDFELVLDPICQGNSYAKLGDHQDIEFLEGDGTFQPLVDANTVCVAWEYTARVQSADLYVELSLMIAGSPQSFRNRLTGSMGLFAGSQSFAHYEGACELTVPDVSEQLYPRISLSEANLEEKLADLDSLIIRPVPCTVNTTKCLFEEI